MKNSFKLLSNGLRFGFVAASTSCIGLLFVSHIGSNYRDELHIEQSVDALQISIGLLFLVSLGNLPFNRRIAFAGILMSVIFLLVYPLGIRVSKV